MTPIDELIDLLTPLVGSKPEDTPEVTRLRARTEEFLGALLGLPPELRAELDRGMAERLGEDEDDA